MVLSSLWYVPVAELGGVARHVLDVARTGLPGVRLTVLCPEGPLAVRLRAQGAAVLTGPVAPGDGAARALRTLRRVLRRLRPAVLHTHLAFADLVGAAAVATLPRRHRPALLSTEHGISGVRGYYQRGRLRAALRRAAHRWRLRRTDAVIAVSASTAEQIRAQWSEDAPITVVPNAVDAPADPPTPRPGLRVLSLARLAPEKRQDVLLEAFAALAATAPEATLTLAGEGPEREALAARAGQLGLTGRVEMLGHLEPGPALAAHDVLVQLSVWENLSYALLDAAAHGLGVLATDAGGSAELLPARCLVSEAELADPASLAARIVAQGRDLAARPGPAAGDLAAMTAGTAAVTVGVSAG